MDFVRMAGACCFAKGEVRLELAKRVRAAEPGSWREDPADEEELPNRELARGPG